MLFNQWGKVACRTLLVSFVGVGFVLTGCGGGGGGNSNETVTPPSSSVLVNPRISFIDDSNIFDVVVSPNGQFVYARAENGESGVERIDCLQWNEISGHYERNISCAINLDASPKAISSDGQNIYLRADSGAVAYVMSLNSSTGRAELQQTIDFQTLITDSPFFPSEIEIRPDGNFAYITNVVSGDIAIFSRQSDGFLQFIQHQDLEGAGAFDAKITFSSDSQVFYVAGREGIRSYSSDVNSGLPSLVDEFGEASFVDDWANGFFEVVSDISINLQRGEIYVLGVARIMNDSGSFALVEALVGVGISSSGMMSYRSQYVFGPAATFHGDKIGDVVQNFSNDEINVVLKKENISVYDTSHMYTLMSNGTNGLQLIGNSEILSLEGPYTPKAVYVTSTNRTLVSSRFNGSSIIAIEGSGHSIVESKISFSQNEIDGLQSVVQTVANSSNGTVYSLSIHDPMDNAGDNALVVYRFDTSTSSLSKLQSIRFSSSKEVSSPLESSSMKLSPDGQHLYVFGRTQIMIYAVDSDNGFLTKVDIAGEDQISPVDAQRLYGGALSDDGRHLYTTSENIAEQPFITVFERDLVTGVLQETSSFYINANYSGAHFLRKKPFISISPNGQVLYYFDKVFALVAQFNRDVITGELTLRSVLQDGDIDNDGTVLEGLVEATYGTISSSGEYLYLASDEIYAAVSPFTGLPTNTVGLQVFSIDPTTGDLTSQQVIKRNSTDDSGTVFDFGFIKGGYRSIVLSDDNEYLYAIVNRLRTMFEHPFGNSHGIDVFKIDQESGRLSFVQRLEESFYGRGASSLSLLSGTNDILIANEHTDRIGMLERNLD